MDQIAIDYLESKAEKLQISYAKEQREEYLRRISQLVNCYKYPVQLAIEQAFNEEII